MIKNRYALISVTSEKELTIFRYHGDIIKDIKEWIVEQFIFDDDGKKDIAFYQFYFDIPQENIIII